MKIQQRIHLFRLPVAACLFIFGMANAQVAVITHRNVPVDEIKKTQLLDFYTGDIRLWEDGRAVIVFDLKSKGDTRDAFFSFLGKSSSRMKSIWLKRMLSGEGDPPEALESEADMVRRVAATPGAIGFVSDSTKGLDKVKVLKVIGKEE